MRRRVMSRWMARYTVERPTPKRSASSATLCSPARCNATRGLLADVELGLLASKSALGLRHSHSLPRPEPDQVRLELGHHGEHVEQQPAHGVGGVVHGASEAELDLSAGEVLDDGPGVGQRASQAIELGDDRCVAGPAGSQGRGSTSDATAAGSSRSAPMIVAASWSRAGTQDAYVFNVTLGFACPSRPATVLTSTPSDFSTTTERASRSTADHRSAHTSPRRAPSAAATRRKVGQVQWLSATASRE